MFKSFPGIDRRFPAGRNRTDPATPPPLSVQRAVRFMYAGAAVSAVFIVFSVIVTVAERSSLINALIAWNKTQPKSKQWTLTQIHNYPTNLLVYTIIIGLIAIGLWLWMARMNNRGRSWARITATVLFVLWTLYTYEYIGSTRGSALLITTTGIVLVIWLAGLGALFYLWRADSSEYFRAQSAPAAPSSPSPVKPSSSQKTSSSSRNSTKPPNRRTR